MPDLKSELLKLPSLDSLRFDDEPDVPDIPVDVMDTSEPAPMTMRQRIWEAVKLYPASSVSELSSKMGVDPKFIHPQVATMVTKGLLTRSYHGNSVFFTTAVDEYPVFNRSQHMRSVQPEGAASVRGGRRKRQEAVTKAKPRPEVPEQATPALAAWDSDALLATMNILQARELYVKLKEIFGG